MILTRNGTNSRNQTGPNSCDSSSKSFFALNSCSSGSGYVVWFSYSSSGSSFHLQSIPVLVDPDVQFGSDIHVPMSKCRPHLLGFTVNAKDSRSFVLRQKILFN